MVCRRIINKRPAGIGSLFTDSISVNDFSGGISAAQVLSRYSPQRPVVIGGSAFDRRSQNRINGCKTSEDRIPPNLSFRSGTAQVFTTATWFFRSAVQSIAAPLSSIQADSFMSHMRHPTHALFCCSDRLAEATFASR
jgi:DNA-binding LacI/PurR family transcriptional regulator